MEELWDVLDCNGNPTGEIMKKYDQKVFDRGLYHLGADIWIINNENKILIQKRSEHKKLDPNVWAMTGGSVISGENSKETIVRESKEELNIKIDPNDLKLLTKFKTGNVWVDTYILKGDFNIDEMKFQEEEVSEAKWATFDEINQLVKENNFIPNRWQFVGEYIKQELDN